MKFFHKKDDRNYRRMPLVERRIVSSSDETNDSFFPKLDWNKYLRKSLSLLVLIFLLVWVSISCHQNHTFPIKTVKIVASFEHLDPNNIKNIVNPYTTSGFLNFNSAKLGQDLIDVPWIHSVSIQKIWPDQIIITLEEQKPVAFWNTNSLLNKDGKIFTPDLNNFTEKLPHLFGQDEDAKEILSAFFAMNQILLPLQYSITDLIVNNRHAVTITLNTGTKIILGEDDVLEKLRFFVRNYPKIQGAHKKASVINLCYHNGLAVRWEDDSDGVKSASKLKEIQNH